MHVRGSTMALKLKADVTRSPKQGYQWPQIADWCRPKCLNGRVVGHSRITWDYRIKSDKTGFFCQNWKPWCQCCQLYQFGAVLQKKLIGTINIYIATFEIVLVNTIYVSPKRWMVFHWQIRCWIKSHWRQLFTTWFFSLRLVLWKSRLGDVGQGFNIVKVELDTYVTVKCPVTFLHRDFLLRL